MHNTNIAYYEIESQKFDVFSYFELRIQEMKRHSEYGPL